MADSKTTTDHSVIQTWAEQRGGKPAVVQGTGDNNSAGVLRINFAESDNDRIIDITWEEFFQTFDENGLTFLYQEQSADGKTSRFSKFVNQDNIQSTPE